MDTKLTPKLNVDLDGRVAERTAQLAAANEQLRTEVAERRRAEAQFRYQAQLLATVKDAVIATDEHLMITSWNPAAEVIYGWKAGEVIGRPIVEVLQTEYDGTTREAARQTAAETDEYRGEVTQRRKDESPVPIESTVRALRDANGRPMGLVGVNRDITERKQAEAALQESEAKYRRLVETSHDVIYSLDVEGRITFLNQAAKRVYGYEPQELIGRLYSDFVPSEQLQKNLAFGETIRTSREVIEGYENVFIRKDGTPAILSTNVVWLRDAQGNIVGSSGTARDITALKQAQEAERHLLEEVRAAHARLQALSQ
ncbi:MAG: multi-sensor signal transduction histidine kinase, partial [Anaerolineales bacterium]|nr:multi-sensor signal transduction histidine kinase [Anaerolineales bacterium]